MKKTTIVFSKPTYIREKRSIDQALSVNIFQIDMVNLDKESDFEKAQNAFTYRRNF